MPSLRATSPEPLILALDTSSSLGSVALARGATLLGTRAFEADHGHSRKLLPAIEGLLSESGRPVSEVELFAAVIGPGSFTGLRVSLACVRGLAGEKPCFGALATEAAAWAARGRGSNILALTDLFHGEVFGAVHDQRGDLVSRWESGELNAVLLALADSLPGATLAVGSATVRHRDAMKAWRATTAFLDLPEGLAPHLASLAAARAAGGATGRAGELLPFYLRDPLTRGLLATPPKSR